MSKLNQDELLEEFEIAFSHLPYVVKAKYGLDGEAYRRHQQNEQAYNQIVALIKKSEVTEEWIEEKAKELAQLILRLVELYEHNGIPMEGEKIIKDFIRSLVEEIHGRKEDKL